LVDQYGQDAVYQSIAGTRISNFLLENANVTTVVATEDDKEDVYDADAAEDDAEQEDTEE
jgi:hypothetical protein